MARRELLELFAVLLDGCDTRREPAVSSGLNVKLQSGRGPAVGGAAVGVPFISDAKQTEPSLPQPQ